MVFKHCVLISLFGLLIGSANAQAPEAIFKDMEAKAACIARGKCKASDFDNLYTTNKEVCQILVDGEICQENVKDKADLRQCDKDADIPRETKLGECWKGTKNAGASLLDIILSPIQTAKAAYSGVVSTIDSTKLYIVNEYDRVSEEDSTKEAIREFRERHRNRKMEKLHQYLTENFDIASETVILSKTAGNLLDDLLDSAIEKGNEAAFVYNYCLSKAALAKKGCHALATVAIPYAGAKIGGKLLSITPLNRTIRKRWAKKIESLEAELRRERIEAYHPRDRNPEALEAGIRRYQKRAAVVRKALQRLQQMPLSKRDIKNLTLNHLEAISRANRIPDAVERQTLLDETFKGYQGEKISDRLFKYGVISTMPVSPRVYGILGGRDISDKEMRALAKTGDMEDISQQKSFLQSEGFKDETITQLLADPDILRTPPPLSNILPVGKPSTLNRDIDIVRGFTHLRTRRSYDSRQTQALIRAEYTNSFEGFDRITQLRAVKEMLKDADIPSSEIQSLMETGNFGHVTSNQMNQLFQFNRRTSPPRQQQDFK